MAQNKFIIDGGFTTNAASSIAGQLDMTGSILPTVDSNGTTGYDLGSTAKKWRDLYLSQGSLYINNQKVIEDDSGTIVVSADADQGVTVKTTGTGVTALQSATTINMNGTLQMGATKKITDAAGTAVGFGDKIDMDNNQIINVAAPTADGHATTKLYVDGAISDLVNGAPGALDTLNEIANALGDDANYGATITTALAAATTDRAAVRSEFAAADTAINTAWAAADTADAIAWAAADASQTTSINTAWAAADTAQTSSINTAWAAADTAQTTALQTYADTAETDAIASAEAKDVVRATAAAADATTKADAALAAAVAADVIVTNAHVAADAVVTTAMQTYADQAEADAESAAAIDATTKADAALAAAKVYADANDTDTVYTLPASVVHDTESGALHASDAISISGHTITLTRGDSTTETVVVPDNNDNTTYTGGTGIDLTGTVFSADSTMATKVYADTAIDNLIDSAPGTMSTLNALAAAMGDDLNHVATMTTAITNGDAAVTSAMQTYADQAEADAEAAAATDATTKADAALAAAIAYHHANDTDTVYSHPTHPGDDFGLDTGALTGAYVVSDIDINVTTDTLGHVTDANGTVGTRVLTLADLGYTGATNANYITNNNQLTNGAGYITGYTDTNTTYTAGNGLTLAGTVFSMSGAYTGSFTATGDVTAYSDDSLKTNVQVIDGALGRVEAIRGVTFDRIEDGSTSTGVIAQELKAVLPEAVHTDADGIHSVAYGNITGLLIEAIKELSAQVEELKSK